MQSDATFFEMPLVLLHFPMFLAHWQARCMHLCVLWCSWVAGSSGATREQDVCISMFAGAPDEQDVCFLLSAMAPLESKM